MNADIITFKQQFQQFNSKASFFCACCFMFFIPISTALMNIFIFFAFIFICFSGNIKQHLVLAWQNPISKSALLLFGLLVLGLTWTIADVWESLDTLKKYNELWYIGLLIPIFNTNQRRQIGLTVFLISMGIILFGVYLMFFGLILPIEISIQGKIQHFNIDGGFSSHIITNILMAFAMFVSAHKLILSNKKSWLIYLIFFLLAAYYVLFISKGTTGQIIGILLLSLLFLQYMKMKALIAIPILLIIVSIFALSNNNNSINHAIYKIMTRIDKSHPNYSYDINTRPHLYVHALKTFLEDPWIGTGTGSYREAIKTKQKDFYNRVSHIKNPHSEYLNISVQLGVVGLVLLLYLFSIQGLYSFQIKDKEQKNLAQGLVILILVACTFNSALMDARDGHFWAFFSALLFSNINNKKINISKNLIKNINLSKKNQ